MTHHVERIALAHVVDAVAHRPEDAGVDELMEFVLDLLANDWRVSTLDYCRMRTAEFRAHLRELVEAELKREEGNR